ncbi:MAG: AMP-binding protein [Clostridia bacterium]|nr:AMP-binding protein [Clostridia bacterium]
MNNFQKNILNTEIAAKGTAVSNIGGIIDFSVNITYKEFCEIITEIIWGTPSLRLRLGDDKELYEELNPCLEIPHIVIEGERCELDKRVSKEMRTPFKSIYGSNLFEFAFVEYKGKSAGFLKLHHLIGDAVTIVIICKKIEEGYYKIRNSQVFKCESKAVEYTELSEKQIKNASEYFGKRLDKIPQNRIAERESSDYSADIVRFSLPLKAKNMASEFMASLYVYISAVTDSKKVIIGNVLGNRRKNEMEMAGMFANTLPLVMEFENEYFSDVCKKISRDIFSLLKYSSYSFEELKKYNGVSSNIFDVSVSYKISEFIPEIKIGKVIEYFNGYLDVPIRIFAEEYDDRLDFNIHYRKDIFTEEQINNFGNGILSVLDQDKENKKISEIDVLSPLDRKIYSQLNSTATKHKYRDVIECFKDHLSDNEAVVCGNTSISGYELDRKSDSIAAYISKKQALVVGIKTGRCIEMIEAVIGILKAGAAFMIVSDTITNMDKYCDIVLTREDIAGIDNSEYVCGEYNGKSTAYLVWTSGSTGEPKCIEISRNSLISRLEWANNNYGLKGTILQKTINTFDVSVWEMLSVIYGARLCLLKPGYEKFPDKIAEAITLYGVEKLHFVPSVLNSFINYVRINSLNFPALNTVFSSGEKLEAATVREFCNVFDAELVNLYGPSECTIDVTGYKCSGEYEDVPIGTPADNTEIYIIDSSNKILPVNTWGEICVAGELVGKGYINSDKGGYFKLNNKNAYKTGDIGKIGFDSLIYIYGRNDSQVKVRGMRINLSEIKNIVLSCKNVTDASVIKVNNRLECFYSGMADVSEIKEKILAKMQVYAVPSVFNRVNKIPFTQNGKADIKSLIKSADNHIANIKEPNNMEKEILSVVSNYVSADVNDNLFDMGLDSVSILEIVCSLQEKGMDITFGDFYEGLSVRKIADNISNKKYYIWLKKQNSKKLLICFPYAGGEPNYFEHIAKGLDCDAAGVYISAFDKNADIANITDILINEIPVEKYNDIYLYGHCVGCVNVIEFVKRLKEKIKGVVFAAPSVTGNIPFIVSPWRLLSDGLIKKILIKAGGEDNKYNPAIISAFRKDTDRFFRYISQRYSSVDLDCKICVILGSDDLFTKNSSKIISELKKRIRGNYDIELIKGGRHFITETNSEDICGIINNMML